MRFARCCECRRNFMNAEYDIREYETIRDRSFSNLALQTNDKGVFHFDSSEILSLARY